nr:tetratricopeptide repeat protein [Ktedonobacterales bacterium]
MPRAAPVGVAEPVATRQAPLAGSSFEPPRKLRKFLDPINSAYRRYPRQGVRRWIRPPLVACWIIIAGIGSNVANNVYTLVRTGFSGVTPDNLRAALELPGPLADANAPLWAELLFAGGVVALAGASFWATRDLVREHEVGEWRHKREIHDRLPPKGPPPVVAEPSGPPFDDLGAPDDEHFVGRVADLEWVLARLWEHGLAAITGLPGVGKTALAGVALRRMHAASFPDGIAAISCEGQTGPADVLRLVLARFGAPENELVQEGLDQLGDHARRLFNGKQVLVALDNIEPDWPVGSVITRLRAAGVALLLTARQVLPHAAVPVEASRMLEVLSPEEALRLFAQSFGRPDTLDLTRGERAAAERIVKALGYHTLAIKLEGANAADLALDLGVVANDLEAHPEKGLELAEDEVPAAVQRAFARSVEALPEEARRLFAALAAVPTREFGRRAALALGAGLDPPTSEAVLDLLVRRALAEGRLNPVMPEKSDRQRLQLHLLMRAYASREFARWPERAQRAASAALAVYYAGYANETDDDALGPDEDNIIGMLEWAHDQAEESLVIRLCGGIQVYWRVQARTQASLRYLPWGVAAAEAALGELPPDNAPAGTLEEWQRRAHTLFWLRLNEGYAFQTTGKLDQAEELYTQNLELARQARSRRNEGAALSVLGQIAQRRGKLDEAEGYFQQSLVIRREVQDRQGEGVDLSSLGQ